MQLIFLIEAENLVADLDTGDFLESPIFDRKYLNVPESKFLPLMLQKYCYLPTKLVKILFSLEIVQKKTKSKSNSAAISGFLCKNIINELSHRWKALKMLTKLRCDFCETVDGWNLFLYTTTRQIYFYNI